MKQKILKKNYEKVVSRTNKSVRVAEPPCPERCKIRCSNKFTENQ